MKSHLVDIPNNDVVWNKGVPDTEVSDNSKLLSISLILFEAVIWKFIN